MLCAETVNHICGIFGFHLLKERTQHLLSPIIVFASSFVSVLVLDDHSSYFLDAVGVLSLFFLSVSWQSNWY